MQVSSVNEFVTHAVIGGKQAIDFGISNSAEFFNILSSTLYKDQILAVVREVICNAWDAHIEAGCTDRPVQITLENDKFTIKDFGTGIHHDDMGMIYGTYGNSTKKNDGKQTGGFGLGCKAPFAYTDHFEVTSSHAGIKTIYNLSKSSAQAQGKPGIIPIASFPTDETGLTVSIRIKPQDRQRFLELIKRIVRNGDMNMTLNGDRLGTIGFDASKGNYLIFHGDRLLDATLKIMVRYGNVVYPVESSKEIASQHSAVVLHLNKLGPLGQYQIVFQAPAHSISVTPSRESLSMQEHTVKTLNSLFDGFLNTLKGEFVVECSKYAEGITKKAVAEKLVGELLTRDQRLPALHGDKEIASIFDLKTMAEAYLRTNYPNELSYRKADITRRLKMMVADGLVDQGKAQTFLIAMKSVRKLYQRHNNWRPDSEKNTWLQRRVIAPLLTKLGKAGLASTKLYICDAEDLNYESTSREHVPPLVPATEACPRHLFSTLPYLRNIIVIASRRHGLVDRAHQHEVFKDAGKYNGFLVYNVGIKKGEAEAARKFFTDSGMKVVDLTVQQTWETTAPKPVAVTRAPVKKGLACLNSILSGANYINTHLSREHTAVRIDQPEFVVRVTVRQGDRTNEIPGWDRRNSLLILQLFGDKGGVTTTSLAHENWIKKGAKELDDYVMEKVCHYILFNPRIEEFWAFDGERVSEEARDQHSLINTIYTNPILMTEFGIVDNRTQEDKNYLDLWDHLTRVRVNNPAVIKVRDWLNSIPMSAVSTQMIAKLTDNPLLQLLDQYRLNNMLKGDSNSPQVKKTIEILISILNG